MIFAIKKYCYELDSFIFSGMPRTSVHFLPWKNQQGIWNGKIPVGARVIDFFMC